MKMVVQRVTSASCTVEERVTGKIDLGFLVLIGISDEDDHIVADKMVKKLLGLRIFDDADGKTNLALKDVGGSLLLISQFTLYADCGHGNRPSFKEAARPEEANSLYEYFCDKVGQEVHVEKGVFQAEMKVELLNDGPVTILLEKDA